jgi:hypothetical protein
VIVISGALLVIAVVFLGIGLEGALGWVYASIVVSFLAFVFMLIALRQQRNAATDEPAPPAHPLGLSKRPAPDPAAGDTGDSEVTLVTPAPVAATSPDDEPSVAQPVEPAVPTVATTTPDVPLVPATRKSAAKKTTATKAAATKTAATKSAAKKTTAAKKATTGTAKKTAATAAATTRSDPTAPRNVAPRKSAAKKPTVSEGEQTQLAMTDEPDPPEPSES